MVSAKGRAIDMKELHIEPEMGPVDFAMKPGGTVRIRVLDQQGKPVPKARIFFQGWRGRFSYFEFDHVRAIRRPEWRLGVERSTAGRIQGGHLPLRRRDDIAGTDDDRTPGGVCLPTARHSRHLGQSHRRGNQAADQGLSRRPGDPVQPDSHELGSQPDFSASDGHYQIRQTRGYFAHLVRIEADGYLAGGLATSRAPRGTSRSISS